ncbi:hypothetical protein CBOM_00782 [Ceraceosorus bombacis]|uniref:Uncharacterized protein n=1 Tax=Ceraceosorus bombacis TaxID=401625 RepID=A0A0P1BBY9_9BASI|nr:hypothetical protein CBOM_00782 [Ceraceosorus bombacis]
MFGVFNQAAAGSGTSVSAYRITTAIRRSLFLMDPESSSLARLPSAQPRRRRRSRQGSFD